MKATLVVAALLAGSSLGIPTASTAQVATAEALVDGYSRSWNSHDPALLKDIFAPDAAWVTVGGIRLTDLATVQAAIAKEHSTWAKSTSLATHNTVVRLVAKDIAVIYFDWEISGALDRDGKPAPAFRGVSMFVASKGGKGWQVVAGQASNTRQTPR